MKLSYSLAALLLAFSSSAWATFNDYRFYVGGHIGTTVIDDKYLSGTLLEWESGPLLGGELGIQPFSNEHLELRLKIERAKLEIALGASEEAVNSTWVNADLLWFLPDRYYYLLGGSHYQLMEVGSRDWDQPGFHFGVGARYPINQRWALTGEAQVKYGVDERTVDSVLTLGVQYFFGQKSRHQAIADTDHDGVLNRHDQCPSTPAGYSVDDKGCTLFREQTVTRQIVILFGHNDAQIHSEYYDNVEQIARFLKQHPQLDVVVEGHTSQVGTPDYNQGLSERRAASVQQLLVERFEVDPQRVKIKGYGESQPIVLPEVTPEDSAKNRRIMVEMSVRERLL